MQTSPPISCECAHSHLAAALQPSSSLLFIFRIFVAWNFRCFDFLMFRFFYGRNYIILSNSRSFYFKNEANGDSSLGWWKNYLSALDLDGKSVLQNRFGTVKLLLGHLRLCNIAVPKKCLKIALLGMVESNLPPEQDPFWAVFPPE